jgi:quinol monooxygenase YgiN
MIHIVAVVTAQPGRLSEVLALVRANTPAVRAEPGCIEYTPLVDMPGSAAQFGADTFVVVEKWADAAALDMHRKAPHMLAYVARSKELIASRRIHLLTPISAA